MRKLLNDLALFPGATSPDGASDLLLKTKCRFFISHGQGRGRGRGGLQFELTKVVMLSDLRVKVIGISDGFVVNKRVDWYRKGDMMKW